MVTSEKLLDELKRDVPEFLHYEEFDELLYMDYGRLGTYLMSLIREAGPNRKNGEIVKSVFKHLNRIYSIYGKEVENLIVVSIFEPISESDMYIEIVENGFSEELKELFYQKLTSE